MEKVNSGCNEVITYQSLSPEVRAVVDEKVKTIRSLSSSELLNFGSKLQKTATEFSGDTLRQMSERWQGDTFEELLEDVTSRVYGINGKKKLVALFSPKKYSTNGLVGSIDNLRNFVESQISGLMEDNARHEVYIGLLKESIDEITTDVLALGICIDECESKDLATSNDLVKTEEYFYLKRLKDRKEALEVMKVSSLQVAISTMIVHNNNVLLSDKLKIVEDIHLPVLQSQVLLGMSINDTKRGLDTCDRVNGALVSLAEKNSRELHDVSERLGVASSIGASNSTKELIDVMSKMVDEVKALNSSAKAEFKAMEKKMDKGSDDLDKILDDLRKKYESHELMAGSTT